MSVAREIAKAFVAAKLLDGILEHDTNVVPAQVDVVDLFAPELGPDDLVRRGHLGSAAGARNLAQHPALRAGARARRKRARGQASVVRPPFFFII